MVPGRVYIPFDIYPSPEAVSIQDGSLVEKQKLSRAQLVALKDERGYDAKAIDSVLMNFESVDEDWLSLTNDNGLCLHIPVEEVRQVYIYA